MNSHSKESTKTLPKEVNDIVATAPIRSLAHLLRARNLEYPCLRGFGVFCVHQVLRRRIPLTQKELKNILAKKGCVQMVFDIRIYSGALLFLNKGTVRSPPRNRAEQRRPLSVSMPHNCSCSTPCDKCESKCEQSVVTAA